MSELMDNRVTNHVPDPASYVVPKPRPRFESYIPSKLASIKQLIGNTPLIRLRLNYRGQERHVYAKLEYYNLSGSIKDRMALEVLESAYTSGELSEGDMIVEATSGNAGIALSALGKALGHPVRIYMPDWMSTERVALMKSYGADVHLISHEQGGFLGCIDMAEALARSRNDVFLPRQFSNQSNCDAHAKTTGPEILEQLGFVPDAFVAGVGTGGTVMGVGRAMKAKSDKVKVHPMEPTESPTLSTGYKVGKHRIQGVSDDFVPPICCLDSLDDVISVNDGDGIIMAQKLSSQLGLAVGISSGANLIAALKVQNTLHNDAKVVTVFCDDNKKYLSTDLMKSEPIEPGYLSPYVELLDFEVC